MKKFIITVTIFVIVALTVNYAYFYLGIYIPHPSRSKPYVAAKTSDMQILLNNDGEYVPFEIKGVDMGSGCPGKQSTDFAVDKETYMRWFSQIQDMGANTIRIYTIQSQPFYEAFYEYNSGRKEPLYLLHGVWVNDHTVNSYRDAYHKDFYNTFLTDCKTMADVIHGKRKLNLGKAASSGHGSYLKDISPWVIGYILGVEWDDFVVAYTDDKYKDNEEILSYNGKYFRTSKNASAFEAMLTRIADKLTDYETERYNEQRLVAFVNRPATDPFEYPDIDPLFINKFAKIDVENILPTDKFLSGVFASYHVYPSFHDYLTYVSDWSDYGLNESEFINQNGELNAYRAYLTMLTNHHSIPVVISEFGIPTSRAMAHTDVNTGRNQGAMSESEQGEALAQCYADIKSAGCAGSCVFSWQDEWFKRTWNTIYAVNTKRTPYWSDYQSASQFFGLLTFDPGAEKSVCYADGDISEWTDGDKAAENGDMSVSVKYDEKFLYFLIYKKGLDFENDSIYLPIDTTQKTGSNYCENFGLKFNRAADFVVAINGADNSRITVQERYESLRANYSQEIYKYDTYEKDNIPEKTSPVFKNIDLILRKKGISTPRNSKTNILTYETGKLKFGNANPESADYDSTADFCAKGDYIEIRLPWQLLNFADPSEMAVHDDYYDGNYGVDFININKMYVGITDGNGRTELEPFKLKGWGNNATYHERLKNSYYVMQKIWGGTNK